MFTMEPRIDIREFDIDDELKVQLAGIWDITNTREEEVDLIMADSNLEAAKQYVNDDWDREDMLNYHMGNMKVNNNGAIYWALKVCTNKVKAVEHYIIDGGIPNTLEKALKDLSDAKSMLQAENKNARIIAYCKNEYNFWNSLSDDELFAL